VINSDEAAIGQEPRARRPHWPIREESRSGTRGNPGSCGRWLAGRTGDLAVILTAHT
jgi:hypothetical protein